MTFDWHQFDGMSPGDLKVWYRSDISVNPVLVVLLRRLEGHRSFWEVLGEDGNVYVVRWPYLLDTVLWEGMKDDE